MYYPNVGEIIFGGGLLLAGVALIVFRARFNSGRWFVSPSNPRMAAAMGVCTGILGGFFLIQGLIGR